MLKLVLTDPECIPRDAAESLAREFAELREQPRVYRIYVPGGRAAQGSMLTWEFMTASKDVHLALGQLSRDGLKNLARVLEETFQLTQCSQLLLNAEDWKPMSTLLVTAAYGNHTTYVLVPAR